MRSKLQFANKAKTPDLFLCVLFTTYITMLIASVVLFKQTVIVDIYSVNFKLLGALIPYVFLYPLSFIVLRLYGYKTVNNLIVSMIISSFIFFVFCTFVISLPNGHQASALAEILSSSFRMYLVGFIAMPAGIYSSFLMLAMLSRLGLGFNVFSLSIATIFGEFINTIMVFPFGFHGMHSMATILSDIIVDALIFKFVMSIILSIFCILIINLALKLRLD